MLSFIAYASHLYRPIHCDHSGLYGQLPEWPEVITEGETIADCRDRLRDVLLEMIAAYRQLGQPIPEGQA